VPSDDAFLAALVDLAGDDCAAPPAKRARQDADADEDAPAAATVRRHGREYRL
jgi:hypothetical protein